MAKKIGRKSVHAAVPFEQRDEAKRIFVESAGKISFTEIAKRVGVNRNSVARWAKNEKWGMAAAGVERAVAKEIEDRVAKSYADKVGPLLDEAIGTMRIMAHFARVKAINHDAAGRPIVDASGAPQPAPGLSETGLNTLMNVITTYYKTLRLHSGMTTDNMNVGGHVTKEVTIKDDDQFTKAISKVAVDGDKELQDMMITMLATRQKISAKMNEAATQDD